jgi:uncharacterized protein (TIGR02996 family)
MTYDEAFLQAICERPDDNAPRLIFADWLDDHGEPERAELIRVQVALARLPDDAAAVPALRRRECDLLAEHEMDWAGPLLDLGAVAWVFRRGLPAWVTLTADDFLRHAAALVRDTPVRRVKLLDAGRRGPELARRPELADLAKLNLSDNDLGDRDVAALAGSAYLGGLTALDLGGNRLGAAGAQNLAAAPALGRLTRLGLRACDLGDDGVAWLARSAFLAGLRRLDLGSNGVGDGGARAVAAAPHLGRLARLDLEYNAAVGPDGLGALAASPHLAALTDLRLAETGCGDAGAAALAASPLMGRLSRLGLGRDVGVAGLRAVLSAPRPGGAFSLRLEKSPAVRRDRTGQPSKAPPPPGELRVSAVCGGDLVELLTGADLPAGLTELRLHGFGLSADQAGRLAAWPRLAGLSRLEVGGAAVEDGAARALAAAPSAGDLRHLRLEASRLGDRAVQALLASPALAGLEELTLEVAPPHTGEEPRLGADTLRALASSGRAHLDGADTDALLRRDDWPLPWRRWLAGPRLDRLLATHEVTDLGDADVERLAALPVLTRLVELDLFLVRTGPAGARALAASPFVAGLRSLRLSFSPVGDEGAAAVAASPHLGNLRTLKLSFCGVGDAGVRALAASPFLTRLTTLKLWGDGPDSPSKVGDEGARAIAASAALANLVKLRLRDNAIGDAGAQALAEAPGLRRLLDLSLSGNPISPAGWERLRSRFGRRLGLALGAWDRLD